MDPIPSEQDSPRKRQRLDSQNDSISLPTKANENGTMPPDDSVSSLAILNTNDESAKEREAGITEYISSTAARFSGILKKRYTDFLVNEILPDGQVLHLVQSAPLAAKNTQNEPPPAPSQPVPTAESSSITEGDASGAPAQQSLDKNAVDMKGRPIEEEGATKTESTVPDRQAIETESFEISAADKAELESHFNAGTLQSILDLHEKVLRSPSAKSRSLGYFKSQIIDDRTQRTAIHKSIRRIFSSKLDTSTDEDGAIKFSASSTTDRPGSKAMQQGRKQLQVKGKVGWQELGGEYLHFTIHKENRDTMEVISFLAREMKLNPKAFQFAGTKDRRAVTVQRASGFRLTSNRLAAVSKKLRGSALGGYEHKSHGLGLGELAGNEFLITLRDCHINNGVAGVPSQRSAYDVILESLNSLSVKGFLNYFGLQRFGAFSTKTDVIGLKMLQGDFKAACDSVLAYTSEALDSAQGFPSSNLQNLVSSDDKARAKAINSFEKSGRANPALTELPRKFSAEAALIRHLSGQNRKNDYQGALQSIPRNLRTMYVHAYQSLVWNLAAGERWRRFGNQVVEGDLVLVKEHRDRSNEALVTDTVDESGEVVVQPGAEDSAIPQDDMFERARSLSKEEVETGKYTIFDVVLPTPGFDILYPSNSLAEFYKDFMKSERGGGLDPYDMRRNWRDISLSGSYRKFLARPLTGGPLQCKVVPYHQDDEQLVQTDLEKLQGTSNAYANMDGTGGDEKEASEFAAISGSGKIAVILRLQLGTGQYATMALRELLGAGGLRVWKPDFGGGR